MAYIVTKNCVDCKFTTCVAACPVDCFYELANQLVIDPVDCIDCHACVPECPVEAIFPDHELPEQYIDAIAFNKEQSERLINQGIESIIFEKAPLPTAEAKKKVLGF